MPNNALKGERLVIYGTCEAGKGGLYGANLVNTTYEKGAQTVIGFQGLTYVNEMNRWLYTFLTKSVDEKLTVNEAMLEADSEVRRLFSGSLGGLGDRLVRGSVSQRLAD